MKQSKRAKADVFGSEHVGDLIEVHIAIAIRGKVGMVEYDGEEEGEGGGSIHDVKQLVTAACHGCGQVLISANVVKYHGKEVEKPLIFSKINSGEYAERAGLCQSCFGFIQAFMKENNIAFEGYFIKAGNDWAPTCHTILADNGIYVKGFPLHIFATIDNVGS